VLKVLNQIVTTPLCIHAAEALCARVHVRLLLNSKDLFVLQWDREAAEAALRREMMLQAEIPRLYEVCIFDPLFGNLIGPEGACAIVSWLAWFECGIIMDCSNVTPGSASFRKFLTLP
jgi:hypothetical protein